LALASDYPNHSTVSDEPKRATLPKHILVDFKSVTGSASSDPVTVLLYLRTKTQRLTESFSVFLQPNTLLIDLSAVLFRDLPISITKDDVFLVTEVYEDIPVSKGQSKTVRRGFAAGAADISRLFRMEESVESPFTIRMFSNYFSASEPNDENRGWGELVDRIIRGRPRGV
jgi:dedicator of cytokinesis protein 3